MIDKKFKALKHSYLNHSIELTGSELTKEYKPDVVLKDSNHYVILESEHSTNRKTFLGGLLKAAKFLTGKNQGILVFVMKIQSNTKIEQITNHLGSYLRYIEPISNLKEVFVISDEEYCRNENHPLPIKSEVFNSVARKV